MGIRCVRPAWIAGAKSFRSAKDRDRRGSDRDPHPVAVRNKPAGDGDILLPDGPGVISAGTVPRPANRKLELGYHRNGRVVPDAFDLYLHHWKIGWAGDGFRSGAFRYLTGAADERAQDVGCLCRDAHSIAHIRVHASWSFDTEALSNLIHQGRFTLEGDRANVHPAIFVRL